jgi:hypothetical protein
MEHCSEMKKIHFMVHILFYWVREVKSIGWRVVDKMELFLCRWEAEAPRSMVSWCVVDELELFCTNGKLRSRGAQWANAWLSENS